MAWGPKPPPPVSVRIHDSFDLTAAISPDSSAGSVYSRNCRAHESVPAPPPPVSDWLTQQFDLAIVESSESEAGDSVAQRRAQQRELQALLADDDEAVARQDTVTQLIAQIRRVGRDVPGATGRVGVHQAS